MQNDLLSEQRIMKSLWKKRQTQIDNIIDSTINFHSTLLGIAGKDVLELQSLKITNLI